MDTNKNTLGSLLKNLPMFYNKTLGTVASSPITFPNLTYARKSASNIVNLFDSVGSATDALLIASDAVEQETLIGITPIKLHDILGITQYIDEVALPGYVFDISITDSSTGNAIGYPRNLSKSFYVTINNTGDPISIPFSIVYGNFSDGVIGNYTPTSITTDGTYLYIVDKNANVVIKSTMQGGFVSSWGTWNALAQVYNGNIPVTNNGIPVLTPNPNSPGVNDLNSPSGITNDGTYLYTVDSGNNRVLQTLLDGTLISSWGTLGSGTLNLNNPTGIITDGSYLYVVDTGNNRIVKLTMPLQQYSPFLATWGTLGTGNTNLKNPTSVTVSGSYLYICDTGNNRIVQIPTSLAAGPYTAYWGSNGSGTTNLASPLGLTTDNVYLYVTDTGNNRVVKIVLPLNPITPFTSSWSIPDSTPGSTVNILYYGTFLYNSAVQPVLFTCDTSAGVIATDLIGTELGEFQFIVSTAKLITVPHGATVTLQYTPNLTNPYTIPGAYALIQSSVLPQIQPNYNIVSTENGYGADSDSFTYPGFPDCLDSVGISFGVPRIGGRSLSGETDADYKNRIKIQAFGNKVTLPGVLYQLKQNFPSDPTLKVYEGFTQPGVNTGFSSFTKNTSAQDLASFMVAYPGYPTSIIVYSYNSNTKQITPISVTGFVATLSGFNPFNIYVVFSSGAYLNRGAYSGGDNSSATPFSPTAPIGSFDDLYNTIANPPYSDPSHAEFLTKTFGSNATPPNQTYGGFLDSEKYVTTVVTQKLAFIVDSVKAAGITAYFIQLL